jgi:P27 family predicted phage terminase small subunit
MPKRTPNSTKLLSGSPNAKPVTAAEPLSKRPVAGLDKIAQKEWKRIRQAFASTGRLTELDESVLMLYCAAFSRWKRAEAGLLNEGEVIWLEVRDTHGNVTHKKPVTNPLAKVAESAARQVHRFGDALGLSPASRIKQGFHHEAREFGGKGIFDLLKVEKTKNETAA